jgi:hypothetical protein
VHLVALVGDQQGEAGQAVGGQIGLETFEALQMLGPARVLLDAFEIDEAGVLGGVERGEAAADRGGGAAGDDG